MMKSMKNMVDWNNAVSVYTIRPDGSPACGTRCRKDETELCGNRAYPSGLLEEGTGTAARMLWRTERMNRRSGN